MSQIIKETVEIILGSKAASYYLAGFFFSLLAIVLSLRVHSLSRDKESPNTPKEFSWKFLLWDNGKRIVSGLIIMFILFRATDLSNIWGMLSVGFGIGFGQDKMIQIIMERSNILDFLQPSRKNSETK